MNAKKISQILFVIGTICILVGLITVLSNLDKKFDPSKSEQTIFGRDDLGNRLSLESENMDRSMNRKAGIPYISLGIFLLIGGFISSKIKPRASVNNLSNLEGLERLAKLKEQNLLTDEEFEVQKKKILNP